MKNKRSLIFLLFAELICFLITRINVFSYNNDIIYVWAMNIIQILYFLPVLLVALFSLIATKSDKKLLINVTIGLILYAIFLHIFILPIASLFSSKQGIVNFTEYAWKIYSICLPFVGFHVFVIKKENAKKAHFLLIFKIILLTFITFILSKLFSLKGVLYAWPLSEIIYLLFLFIRYKKPGT